MEEAAAFGSISQREDALAFASTRPEEATSLQDGFKKWKKSQRKAAKRLEKSDAGSPTCGPPDPSQKAALRSKFLQLIQSYIGTPYARRFHEPGGACACEGCSQSGRQLHGDPLFLDCCGLVRRVMRRMRRLLGFRLGPGNQAYQFDTLPLRVGSVAELEPGDLIFYSGAPFDTSARRYPFHMTHIEVFVGGSSGEATIGSRERFKWVMQYDSYRFTSARWSLIDHHFCKLDTWLEGVCRPQHPEYWASKQGWNAGRAAAGEAAALVWDPKKFSIFSAGADGDDGDDDQGGQEDGQQAGDD